MRPTTDRAKEALFNILNNQFYIDEISALDLFSGTGNISFELASRGCDRITAVDQNPACTRFIEKITDELELEGLSVVRSEVLTYLSRDFGEYDLIFADPPYSFEDYEKLVNLVILNKLLKPEGVMIIEHDHRVKLDELSHFQTTRQYGNVAFSFFNAQA